MKTLFLLGILLSLAVFTSCKTKNANLNTAQPDSLKVTRTDTLQIAQLDISTPEKFIQSLIDNIKQLAEGETEVTGELAFRKGDFSIFNFTESHGVYYFPFSVVLNPAEKIEEQTDKIEEVPGILQGQKGLKYSFYNGHFAAIKDLQNDGSPDFILEYFSNFRTQNDDFSEIVLFDGKNRLESTKITAESSYDRSGPGYIENDTIEYDYDGYFGTCEFFEFTGENPVNIIIHGITDYYGTGTSYYDKKWGWIINNGKWTAELVSIDSTGSPEAGEYQKRIIECLKKLPILKDKFKCLYKTENQKSSGKWVSLDTDFFAESSGRYFWVKKEGYWFTLDFGNEKTCCDRLLIQDILISDHSITFTGIWQYQKDVNLWTTDKKGGDIRQFNFNPAENIMDDANVSWIIADSIRNYAWMFDLPLQGNPEEIYPYQDYESITIVKQGAPLYLNPGEKIVGTLPSRAKCILVNKGTEANMEGVKGSWYEVHYILSQDTNRISGVIGWLFCPDTSKAGT